MKFKTYGVLLGLFFALGLVFSFSIKNAEGSHDGADKVDPGDEQEMSTLLSHAIDYYNQVREEYSDDRAALIRQLTIFARDIRRDSADGGFYKHDDIYMIDVNDLGIVTNHAGHPKKLIGHKVDRNAEGSEVLGTLTSLLDDPDLGVGKTPVCKRYEDDKRVACAAKVDSDLTVDVTNIIGLRHAEDDSAFSPPDCSGLELDTTAKDVYEDPTDANLEAYVRDIIKAIQADVARISLEEAGKLIAQDQSLSQDLARLAELAEGPITTRIQERTFCFGQEDGDFKHGNIYAFIMSADLENSTVIVNGNNFDLNGGNLALEDEELDHEDKTIAGLFSRALAGGTSAYANYRWDDPTTDADNIRNWFEINSVPGTSHKRSYIEVADLYAETQEAPAQHYIFGSGIYLKEDSGGDNDDDGGCAIAGAGSTSQGALLNLLLTASVLFSVVFMRRRT